MRIYSEPFQAVREVERDLWEIGIDVHPQTMQDQYVADNPDFMTKELQGYAFKIMDWVWHPQTEANVVKYVLKRDDQSVIDYIDFEFQDRVSGVPQNPGHSWVKRMDLWKQFLHNGKFHYTYSERIAPQLHRIVHELTEKPDTRQAIINIHSNICPHDWSRSGAQVNDVSRSADLENMGGAGRVPCSMYYQLMRRSNKLDLIYTMRSCDYLTHFPVDLMLALRLQNWVAKRLDIGPGAFTYFAGSLHCYRKDMAKRGVF